MHVFASPRRGYCASCDSLLPDPARPVYRMDETYCCVGCAHGGPCICTYEQDLADDGVDHLGLAFQDPKLSTSEPLDREVVAR